MKARHGAMYMLNTYLHSIVKEESTMLVLSVAGI